jgi:hypothetical protein
MKIRCGEDLGIDLERVIGWVLVKNCCREYQFPSLGNSIEKATLQVEDRLLLYTSGETLVLTATTLGVDLFIRVHNLLIHFFEHDLSKDNYIKVTPDYGSSEILVSSVLEDGKINNCGDIIEDYVGEAILDRFVDPEEFNTDCYTDC